MQPDIQELVPEAQVRGEDEEETNQLREMRSEASAFLSGFGWCRGIKRGFMGIGIGGVASVWLFEIDAAADNVDSWVWVVVGDLPPAYLSPEYCSTTVEALEAYVAEMDAWVEAVRCGRELTDIIPVNAPPTPESADLLFSRLRFLEDQVIPALKTGALRPVR